MDQVETQFLVLGDWGTSFDIYSFGEIKSTNNASKTTKQEVSEQMTSVCRKHEECCTNASFCVVSVGDNFYPNGVSSVDDPQWTESFSDAYSGVKCDWYSVLGNHDWEGDPQAQIDFKTDPRWHIDAFYYTKLINNVEFVFLDTVTLCPNHSKSIIGGWNKSHSDVAEGLMNEQMKWLEQTLASSAAEWIVVVGHYPVFSGGLYRNLTEMQKVNDLMKKYRADAYFCGHDHSLQHIYNPKATQFHHFVSGTGSSAAGLGYSVREIPFKTVFCQNTAGFLNVTVAGNVMNVKFISNTGDVLHFVDIEKQNRNIPLKAVSSCCVH